MRSGAAPRAGRTGRALLLCLLGGLSGCTCGNPSAGADSGAAVLPIPPPAPPPTLPPPTTPAHVGVPEAAASSLGQLRTDLARGADGLVPHLAAELEMETATATTGPVPARVQAYLRHHPDVLLGLAQAIDRGCAAEPAESDGPPHVVCPAEALDDDYQGVAFGLASPDGQRWKIDYLAGP